MSANLPLVLNNKSLYYSSDCGNGRLRNKLYADLAFILIRRIFLSVADAAPVGDGGIHVLQIFPAGQPVIFLLMKPVSLHI